MKYARIVNNEVAETFIPHSGAELADCFHPDIAKQFIECPDKVEQLWKYDGKDFIEPKVPVNLSFKTQAEIDAEVLTIDSTRIEE
jgi:hypothetical protein